MRDARNGSALPSRLLAAAWGPWKRSPSGAGRLEEMSAEQREDLLRSEQQFRALSPQDQQRIRDLHEQIESAPDREKLRATMNRYCKWFETQPPLPPRKLLDKKKTLKERIATVKEFLAKPGPSKDIHLDDRIAGSWPPGWIATPRSTGPDSSRAWPRLHPEIRQASAGPATSGPPRDALAALADGRSERTDAHRGARDGSPPRRAFAGVAREVGSEETRRAGPDHRRLAPRDGHPMNSTRNWPLSSRARRSTMKSAIG